MEMYCGYLWSVFLSLYKNYEVYSSLYLEVKYPKSEENALWPSCLLQDNENTLDGNLH